MFLGSLQREAGFILRVGARVKIVPSDSEAVNNSGTLFEVICIRLSSPPISCQPNDKLHQSCLVIGKVISIIFERRRAFCVFQTNHSN